MSDQRYVKAAIGCLFVAALSGCDTPSSRDMPGAGYAYANSWQGGNYKCTAEGVGAVTTGWAANESDARDNALDKCKERSQSSGACHVTTCINAV